MLTVGTFDLMAHPEQIHLPYGVGAFILIWLFLASFIIFAAIKTRLYQLYPFLFFLSLFVVVFTIGLIDEARYTWAVKARVKEGAVTTVVGCVEAFQPGKFRGPGRDGGSGADERWRVAGAEFHYHQGSLRPGYNVVESRGGLVHANRRVRVSYVDGLRPGGREIVRLEVLQPDCAFVPDPPKS